MKTPCQSSLAVALSALALALGQAQEPVVVRLRDAVGDTVDVAERDSFRLFPNTPGFDHAVILAIPGPEFFAEVTLAAGYKPGRVFLRIMPTQLERIRFLIDTRDYTAGQVRHDTAAARALASFWREIEGRPLQSIAGEPAVVQKDTPSPPVVVTPDESSTAQKSPPVSPVAPTEGQSSEPVVERIHEAVGDTIDAAERDSFGLFPNTVGFRHAALLAVPGPEFFAEVARADGDAVQRVYYRILPGQLERIRFLIDNRDLVTEHQQSDSSAVAALVAFWQEIENRPLRSITGELTDVQQVAPMPAGAAAVGGQQVKPVTIENRYNCALLGTTFGSALGGCIGSWAGLTYVGSHNPGCGPSWSDHRVEPCVYWGASIGATALGTGVGCAMGKKLDNEAAPALPRPGEGKGWRTGCAIGAAVPGLILGAAFFALAGSSHYGKTSPFDVIVNDPGGWTYLPMGLTSLCIAVEITTIGYHIGRSIDRQNAERAEAKRRRLGS